MTLEWLGHSCFLMTTHAGTKALMDPYGKFFGYTTPTLAADLVTSSHDHLDHNKVAAAGPGALAVRTPGLVTVKDLRLRGVPAWHDGKHGARNGPNIIFIFEADGLRVCHCGDLGHELDAKQLKEIGGVDVLLVPCGGFASAGSALAARLVRQLGPAIAIPMHYRTRALGVWGLLFARVEDFVRDNGLPAYREGILQATSATLSGPRRIVILDWEYRKHAQR